MTSPIIVDSIGRVVARMKDPLITDPTLPNPPYYEHGTQAAVNLLLTAKNQRKQLKFQKYPLVYLVQDIPETVEGGYYKFDINIGIMVMTQEKWTTRERYQYNFRDILYPLYNLFLQELKNSALFAWPGMQDRPPHTKWDRPYWGADPGRTKDYFSDPLDCIELVNLRINQRISNCS